MLRRVAFGRGIDGAARLSKARFVPMAPLLAPVGLVGFVGIDAGAFIFSPAERVC